MRKLFKKIITCAIAASCLASMTAPITANAAGTDTAITAEVSSTDATATTQASKAKYYYKKYDKTQTVKRKHTFKNECWYKRVILRGNSKAVKKINKVLKAACDKELEGMPPTTFDETAFNYYEYDVTFFDTHKSKVMYNKNNVISIAVSSNWFQGGVGDGGIKGFTFNLKTGKQLKLTDVCKGSRANLTTAIKNKLISKYGREAFMSELFDKIDANNCNFYLKGKKVVVVFNKYEISYGAAGSFEITFNSKIK